MKNYGFIKPDIADDHFVLGSTASLPQDVIRPDGQWDAYLPGDELQRNENYDTFNCTAFGTENAVEILIKAKYGDEFDFCERDLGIRAGTYPPGNDPHVVAETVRKEGLIPDTLLPMEDAKTIDEYFSYPSKEKETVCDNASFENRKDFKFGHEWVFWGDISIAEQTKKMKDALKYSPLCVALYAWSFDGEKYTRPTNAPDVHWTVIYGYYENGDWKCYDSYDGTKKRLDKNFGFSYVKRYHAEKLLGKIELSVWKKFVALLKSIGILY